VGTKKTDAKGLVFALLLAWSGWAAACEDLLRASPHRISIDKYILSPAAQEDLNAYGIPADEFAAYFVDTNYVPIQERENRFWLVVFQHNPDPRDHGFMDKGYKIVGHQRDGKFLIEEIHRSERENEMGYFRMLSSVHKLGNEKLSLDHAILRCQDIFVKPWTQMKLWVKHRLSLADVQSVLEAPEIGPFKDETHGSLRFVVRGRIADGRMIRAVLGNQGKPCPMTLITAFEEH
jgi:hypothetical protein